MNKLFLFFFLMLWSTTSYNQSVDTSALGITLPSNSHKKIKINSLKKTKDKQLQFFKNGFFLDGLIGFGSIDNNWMGKYAFCVGARVGNNWYLGGTKKWKFGVQANWLRVDALFEESHTYKRRAYWYDVYSNYGMNLSSTAGFINFIRFNDKIGLEANLNIGFNLLTFFWNCVSKDELLGSYDKDETAIIQAGIIANASIKLRLKNFSLGIDVATIYGGCSMNTILWHDGSSSPLFAREMVVHLVNITIGKVF